MDIEWGMWSFVLLLVLGLSSAQIVTRTSSIGGYTALVPVNIRCVNDPKRGLTCNAEYPDQCKEQWNFPNPCTQFNLSQNKTKFVHPFDTTKFLMCGEEGKLYVVQCPQYEVYDEGCGQCVGEGAGLTASCETPLPQIVTNPCSREAILANKLFFAFPGNITKFIHCDIWGKAWERICTPGEVWSPFDIACVNPILLNPCNKRAVDPKVMFSHPCDPFSYLRCQQTEAVEVTCDNGTAFSEHNQTCEPLEMFNGPLENICGNFQFGFREYNVQTSGFSVQKTLTNVNTVGLNTQRILNNGPSSGLSVKQAFNSGMAGQTMNGGQIVGQALNSGQMGGQAMSSGQIGGQTMPSGQISGQTMGTGQTVGGQAMGSGQMIGQGMNSGQTASLTVNTVKETMTQTGIPVGVGTGMTSQGIIIDNMNLLSNGGNMMSNNGLGIAVNGQTSASQTGINNLVTGGGQKNRLNEILNVWRQNVAINGKGVSRINDNSAIVGGMDMRGTGAMQGSSNMQGTGSMQPDMMSVESVHPSQLKEYVFSDTAYSEPCTVENLSNRRTHFRLKGDPHSFLQCDNAGRMYKMPCSTNRKDWFDVYTMTCVDGPIHVDNQVRRGMPNGPVMMATQG